MKRVLQRNDKLRNAIFFDGRKQYEIAIAADLHPAQLSRIVAGIDVPKDAVKDRIVDVLGSTRKRLGLA